MDTSAQRIARGVTFLLLILSTFCTFGQCSDSIRVVRTDSCTVVQMSTERFTELYLCKKNLEILSKEIPNAKEITDSLHKVNKKIQVNLEEEVEAFNIKNTILSTTLEDCSTTLAEVDLDNMYLTYENGRLKEGRKKFVLFGIGIGGGGMLLINLLSR